MKPAIDEKFKHHYQTHLQHLALKGLQPKTIEVYSRTIRRTGVYFERSGHAVTNPWNCLNISS